MDHQQRWNHNIHYHREVLRRVPPGAQTALDIGCGTGMLTRELAAYAEKVVGVDPHTPSLDTARRETTSVNVRYIEASFLEYPFEKGSFDMIAAVASLHHMDIEAALHKISELLKPPGRLVVIGFAASNWPRDLWLDALGSLGHRYYRFHYGWWEHPSPVVLENVSGHRQVRDLALKLLPGAKFRRLML